MKIAIVGCGFVADMYMEMLAFHPSLTVVAAYDIVPANADRFEKYWKVPVYYSADALIKSADFDMILNLTNPRSHYSVSRRFLEAGKHIYSEKPLAMNFGEAAELIAFGAAKSLSVTCAPCIHLSESAQAMKMAIDAGEIGRTLLVYVEMDGNFIAKTPYQKWAGVSGAPWPAEDEFEVGVTLEHAGYCLCWLLMFFGPVARIVSLSSLQYSGKPVGDGEEGPDFSVTCLEFESGVVARLTCSTLAPRDHRFTVIGDEGIILARDPWNYRTPVTIRKYLKIRRRFLLSPFSRRVPLTPTGPKAIRKGASAHDFARGPAELAAAIVAGRRSRMPTDFVLHWNEIALAIGHPHSVYETTTTFEPLDPIREPIF